MVMDPVQMLERAAAQLRSLEGVWARGLAAGGKGGQLDPVIWRDLEEAAAAMAPAPAQVLAPPPMMKARPAPVAPGSFPPVDVFVTDAMVVVNAAIAGVERPGELKVALLGDSRLRLSGTVPVHPLQGRAPGGPAEQMHGPFDRTVPLPVPVRGETAQCFYHNGLLEVWIARQSEGERTVPVGL